jgi:hypothetical protein
MLRCGAAAGTIPQTLGALHRTNERGLLQKTVSAHTATEQRALHTVFQNLQRTVHKFISFEGRIGRLPSSTRGKARHSHSRLYDVYISILIILANFQVRNSVILPTVQEICNKLCVGMTSLCWSSLHVAKLRFYRCI